MMQVGADGLEEILKHTKVFDVEEILINKCKLLEIPPYFIIRQVKTVKYIRESRYLL